MQAVTVCVCDLDTRSLFSFYVCHWLAIRYGYLIAVSMESHCQGIKKEVISQQDKTATIMIKITRHMCLICEWIESSPD